MGQKVIIEVDLDNSDFLRGMRETANQVGRLNGSISGSGTEARRAASNMDSLARNALRSAAAFVGFAGAAITLKNLSTAGFQAAASFEEQRVSLGVLLGDVELGARMLRELQEFSASTPMELGELSTAAQGLMNFGIEADDVLDTLQMLGDTALGNGAKLQTLVMAYGRVQAKGKASMEEVNMAMEAGLPIIAELAEALGVADAEVFNLVSSGQVSAEVFTRAFESMTAEGGQFHDGMAVLADTFNGKLSTAMDNVRLLGGTVFEPAVEGSKDLLDWLTDTTSGLREYIEASREVGDLRRELRRNDGENLTVDDAGIVNQEIARIVGLHDRVAEIRAEMASLSPEDLIGGLGQQLQLELESLQTRLDFAADYEAQLRVQQEIMRGNTAEAQALNYVQGLIERGAAVRAEREREIADEIERQRQIAETAATSRKTAEAEYAEAVRVIGVLRTQGFLTQEQALNRQVSAARRLAETLVDAGYDGLNPFGDGVGEHGDATLLRMAELVPRLTSELQDLAAAQAAAADEQRLRTEMMRDGHRVTQQYLTDEERVAQMLDELDALHSGGYVSLETYRRALEDINVAAGDSVAVWQQIFAEIGYARQEAEQLGGAALDMAMQSLTSGAEQLGYAFGQGEAAIDSFADAAAAMSQVILDQLPQLFIRAGLMLIGTNTPLGLGFIFAGLAGEVAGGFVKGKIDAERAQANALGNVFSAGHVQAFGSGGAFSNSIVTRPTFFAMARGAGLMGEAGPEAVMPLTRDARGRLGVRAAAAGGAMVATEIVINNYTGQSVSRSTERVGDRWKTIIAIGQAADAAAAEGVMDGSQKRFGNRPVGVR